MTKEELKKEITDVIGFSDTQPGRFNSSLELEYADCDPDRPAVFFRYRKKYGHLNPVDGVHGGVIASLADTCAGMAIVAYTGEYVTTTDLSVSFLRALTGDVFLVEVEFTHLGKKMCSCNVKIRDEASGELGATSMASYMLIKNRPAGLTV